MTKTLLEVPTNKVLECMPIIDKYVKPAYDHGIGETKWETLVARSLVGEVLIWIAFLDGQVVGAASTEIIEFDGYRCIHLITSATDNHVGFEDFHPRLYEYTKAQGCRNIQFWGRKGWSRAIDKVSGANKEKYKEVYRVFSMEIDYESNDKLTEPSDETYKSMGSRT